MGNGQSPIDFSSLMLVIYQNEPFIDGLADAIYQGRVDAITKTSKSEEKQADKARAAASLQASIPAVAKAKVEVEGGQQMDATLTTSSEHKMTYSNAYRLHKVRQVFYEQNQVKALRRVDDVKDVSVGDFVEFSATFAKSEFAEVLDLLSPELGSVIAYQKYMSDLKKTGEAFDENTKNGNVALGSSIVSALQKEFRNDLSSEYYAKLTDKHGKVMDASAVVVCDKQFFSNGDTDRLMDGVFTVFGKVIETDPSGKGFSKFERNKLLKRLKQEGLDWLQDQLKSWKDVEDYFDTNLELTTQGTSIKVIPIAIYA